MNKLGTLLIILAMPLIPPAAASAQPFLVDWSTLDGGGASAPGASVGAAYELSGTIAQPDAGPMAGAASVAMSGGPFAVTGGFWQSFAPGCSCRGDLSGDLLRDGDDVQAFVACLIAGGACDCADIDGDANPAATDPDDVTQFVDLLLSAAPACR